MRRFAIIVPAALVWIAAHLGYFAWYHAGLGLDFTPTSALFALLFAGWSLALVLSFAALPLRLLALVVYAATLAWTLLDYAYAQVFDKFLTFSLSRAGSLSLPMLDLLKEYVFLLPRPLLAAAAALFALAVAYAMTLAPLLVRRRLTVGFFHGGRSAYHHARGGLALAVVGLILQTGFIAGAVRAADGYRERVDGQAIAPDEMLGDLGVFGYAIAAKRSKFELKDARRTVISSATDGLAASRTTVEAARGALEALYAGSPVSVQAVVPPAPQERNVIVYQLESIAAWALDQEPSPMPFLESLMAKNGRVGEYYANGCDTIDAEFAASCGFLPETYGPVSDLYSRNDYQCLPSVLKERGYATAMYHANDARFWARNALAPAWGYDEMHFTPEIPFRTPDASVLDRVVDDIKAAGKPSFRYVVGFTSHSPHGEELADYYRSTYDLDIVPYTAPLGETARRMEADEATAREYLGFLTAVDDSIRHLFERLEAEGLLEDTIVVIFGDHRYYQSTVTDPVVNFRDYNRVPFVIAAPGLSAATLAPVASHVDVPSTLFQLIAGADAALPPTFLGHGLFSVERPVGAVTKCLGQASYYDGGKIVSGDVAFNLFRTVPVAGAASFSADEAAAFGQNLRVAAEATDLALKRDDLGPVPTLVIVDADDKVRDDNLADTDGDGLSDLRERGLGSDPRDADSDDDGYSDGEEVSNGYNPAGAGKWLPGER